MQVYACRIEPGNGQRAGQSRRCRAAVARPSGTAVPCRASCYHRQAFDRHRRQIAETFSNPFAGPLGNPHLTGTTVTRMMERLLYMLTSVRRPAHLLELGTFWGNTLAWFAGPCIGSRPLYDPQRIIGVDRNVKMTDVARSNFAKLPSAQRVELIAEEARSVLDRLGGPFDALYLEAKAPGPRGQEVYYLELLRQVYDRLPAGAWVLAHDVTHFCFREPMREYLAYVRDKAHFRESICFDVDWYGLELSIK